MLEAKEMVEIPEISFTRKDKNGNIQEVTVSSFYMDKYDVTVNEFVMYLNDKKSEIDLVENQIQRMQNYLSDYNLIDPNTILINKDGPIFYISWIDAIYYCNYLSEQENLEPCYEFHGKGRIPGKVTWKENANGYRLPTVAEWQAVSEICSEDLNFEYVKETNVLDIELEEKKDKQTNRYGIIDILGYYGKFLWDYYYKEELYIPSKIENPKGPDTFTPDPYAIVYNYPVYECRRVSSCFITKFSTWERYKAHYLYSTTIEASENFTIRLCRNK